MDVGKQRFVVFGADMSKRKYTATAFARLWVTVAKRETSRRSYHQVRDGQFSYRLFVSGKGNIPFDTGKLQDSIFLAERGKRSATIRIPVHYAVYLQYCTRVGASWAPNQHKNWLQKFTSGEYYRTVSRRYEGVRIE